MPPWIKSKALGPGESWLWVGLGWFELDACCWDEIGLDIGMPNLIGFRLKGCHYMDEYCSHYISYQKVQEVVMGSDCVKFTLCLGKKYRKFI